MVGRNRGTGKRGEEGCGRGRLSHDTHRRHEKACGTWRGCVQCKRRPRGGNGLRAAVLAQERRWAAKRDAPSRAAGCGFYTVLSMSYTAAIGQLNALAPELYRQAGQPRRRFSLDEVRTLLKELGDPQKQFRSVLIAGTNGKGSTASTLASILTAAGVRTGLYTSPHLERPNERIRVGREEIGDADFARLYFRVDEAAQTAMRQGSLPQEPSYFEMLTALAFLYYAEKKIDLAVLEVGMGGRLDATNVVEPLVSVITDISLDHMEWLGPTIGTIAREKAGILRRGGTMITLPQHPDANEVLGEVAGELGVHAICAVPFVPAAGTEGEYPVEALGAYDSGRFAACGGASAAKCGAGDRRGGGACPPARAANSRPCDRGGRSPHGVAGAAGALHEERCGMGSGRCAQSGWSVGAAGGPAEAARIQAAEDTDLQLPARQAVGRDGADSLSALRPGDGGADP